MYFWSVLLFVIVAGLTFLWAYAQHQNRRYKWQLIKQFESLKEQFQAKELQLRSQGNEVYPLLKANIEGRALLIERTLRDKFNFFVVNVHTSNPHEVHVQLIPAAHYHGLKTTEKESFSLLQDIDWAYTGHEALAQAIAKEYLDPLLQQSSVFKELFSTLVVYRQAVTLVLFSSTKSIAYDKVLGISARLCQQIAVFIESTPSTKSREKDG
ncbi:hypothetical protein FHS56_001618 [Thermonema lapsum]|uniref:Uncharacterized protein n=1 Tax=Thermonema lapsum TaxID=28195 RepID=A0A846MRL7_9BACT|nr:hypothetical protein [Thermonema lapsum]NIK74105.1 hypothetical protein [Thermonema lapsum]